ncbi:MAG: hypothetical protein KDD59_10520, partial [Bdellovibrionales bacterium]|nr:hypothetical protein [Bdellovibrionales bacterium]
MRIQAQASYHKSADTLLIYKNERDYEDLEKNLLLETEARASLRDNYETPPELIDKLKGCGFNLALDICGTEENKKAPRVITVEQNALTVDWTIKEGEWIWGNVPYSLKVQFIQKMKEQKNLEIIASLFYCPTLPR